VGPAETLDRHDLPRLEGRLGPPERVCDLIAAVPNVTQLWATDRTRDRLGVVAAVAGVAVRALAGWAHPELAERRPRPVVGEAFDHREPGATVGTARRPVPVEPAPGISDVLEAGRAGGDIGRDRPAPSASIPGRDDPEPIAPVGGEVRLLQAFDHGEGGRRTAERGGEPGNGGWIPLNLDLHPSVPQVAHMPGQALADRGAVHERAESHPLDSPRDVDPLPHALGHRGTSIDVATPSVPPRADDGGWTGGG